MAISFVNAGAQATGTTSTAITPALPSGWQERDLLLVVVTTREDSPTPVHTVTGYTQIGSTQFLDLGTTGIAQSLWYKFAGSSESAPSCSCPTPNVIAAHVLAFRGVAETTLLDFTTSQNTNAASTTFTPPSVTTVEAGVWVISAVSTADDNALALSSAQSFTLRTGGADYDTTDGGDCAQGVATRAITSGGTSVTMPTWNQTAFGADAWAYHTIGLRPLRLGTVTAPVAAVAEASGVYLVSKTVRAPTGVTATVTGTKISSGRGFPLVGSETLYAGNLLSLAQQQVEPATYPDTTRWTDAGVTNMEPFASYDAAVVGSWSWAGTNSGASGNLRGQTDTAAASVAPGDVVSAGMWFRHNRAAPGTVSLLVQFYTSGGGFISQAASGNIPIAPNTWEYLTVVNATAPATTDHIRLAFIDGTSTEVRTLWADGAVLVKAASPPIDEGIGGGPNAAAVVGVCGVSVVAAGGPPDVVPVEGTVTCPVGAWFTNRTVGFVSASCGATVIAPYRASTGIERAPVGVVGIVGEPGQSFVAGRGTRPFLVSTATGDAYSNATPSSLAVNVPLKAPVAVDDLVLVFVQWYGTERPTDPVVISDGANTYQVVPSWESPDFVTSLFGSNVQALYSIASATRTAGTNVTATVYADSGQSIAEVHASVLVVRGVGGFGDPLTPKIVASSYYAKSNTSFSGSGSPCSWDRSLAAVNPGDLAVTYLTIVGDEGSIASGYKAKWPLRASPIDRVHDGSPDGFMAQALAYTDTYAAMYSTFGAGVGEGRKIGVFARLHDGAAADVNYATPSRSQTCYWTQFHVRLIGKGPKVPVAATMQATRFVPTSPVSAPGAATVTASGVRIATVPCSMPVAASVSATGTATRTASAAGPVGCSVTTATRKVYASPVTCAGGVTGSAVGVPLMVGAVAAPIAAAVTASGAAVHGKPAAVHLAATVTASGDKSVAAASSAPVGVAGTLTGTKISSHAAVVTVSATATIAAIAVRPGALAAPVGFSATASGTKISGPLVAAPVAASASAVLTRLAVVVAPVAVAATAVGGKISDDAVTGVGGAVGLVAGIRVAAGTVDGPVAVAVSAAGSQIGSEPIVVSLGATMTASGVRTGFGVLAGPVGVTVTVSGAPVSTVVPGAVIAPLAATMTGTVGKSLALPVTVSGGVTASVSAIRVLPATVAAGCSVTVTGVRVSTPVVTAATGCSIATAAVKVATGAAAAPAAAAWSADGAKSAAASASVSGGATAHGVWHRVAFGEAVTVGAAFMTVTVGLPAVTVELSCVSPTVTIGVVAHEIELDAGAPSVTLEVSP